MCIIYNTLLKNNYLHTVFSDFSSQQHSNRNFRARGKVNQGDQNAQPLRSLVPTIIFSASYGCHAHITSIRTETV